MYLNSINIPIFSPNGGSCTFDVIVFIDPIVGFCAELKDYGFIVDHYMINY